MRAREAKDAREREAQKAREEQRRQNEARNREIDRRLKDREDAIRRKEAEMDA